MSKQHGYSLLELLVVLSLFGVLLGISILSMGEFANRAANGAAELATFFKKARSKAIASTLAYKVVPVSSTLIKTTKGTSCTAAQTDDTTLKLKLPAETTLGTTNWSVCYSTRGLASSSYDIVVSDSHQSKFVRVVLGGGVKVL